MKRAILLMILCIGSVGWLAMAQEEGGGVKPKAPAQKEKEAAPPPPVHRSPGRRFDLNFAGGTPKQLVDAISKQLDRPLNVIIPDDEHRDTPLPPLKMAHVTVDELFAALSAATQRTTQVVVGWNYGPGASRTPTYNTGRMSYGFRTSDKTPDENSIWYFYREAPIEAPATDPKEAPPACRYWRSPKRPSNRGLFAFGGN